MTTIRQAVQITKKITGFNKFQSRRLKAGSFHSDHYLRNSARRLEHLASLRVPVAGMTVLEVGAGVGDLSHYYIDRGCQITITEARSKNIDYLKYRYPDADIRFLDMEKPELPEKMRFDIVHCYGLLYHLSNPTSALRFLSDCCQKHLFLSTMVSFGDTAEENLVTESVKRRTQSISGGGCRPTRAWIFDKLNELFEYVYVPLTQPNYHEFHLDWSVPNEHGLSRAIFIASREKMDNNLLSPTLVNCQIRHE